MSIKSPEHWKQVAETLKSTNLRAVEPTLTELDAHLTLRSHLVGYQTTEDELLVWDALRNNHVVRSFMKQGSKANVARWFSYLTEAKDATVLVHRPKSDNVDGRSVGKDSGSNYDIGLQDTDHGVVTRFPPEPSGYLHIGHAKAALLNDYFAHIKYKGKLILRFDDSNPSKEKQEYEDAIVQDLKLLGIKPDEQTRTSDHFTDLHKYCLQMLEEGTAYADDTVQEVMRNERMHGIASKHRDAAPQENIRHFDEMGKGTEEGRRWVIRAKISVDDPNKALRDPVIYRCNPQEHHRTGDKWKMYPTYDFCCPVVDSIEGVTHALRTTEYKDRDPQYQWMLSALRLRKVFNWDFSRLSFIRTLLSKRKLTKVVDSGLVWGWDDPRMPTIRGIRRRGCTIAALQEFILKQGPSKNVVNLDWTVFWATNKKHIDPLAARYTAIAKSDAVTAHVRGAPDAATSEQRPKHTKYSDLGNKTVVYSSEILLEQADAASLSVGEEITMMNWGNAIVREVSHSPDPLKAELVTSIVMELHLQGDPRTTDKKITWLSNAQELSSVELLEFDYLITKDKLGETDQLEDFLNPNTEFRVSAIGDCNVAHLKENDILQFDRKGYFRVDKAVKDGEPAVCIQIPTGKTK